MIFDLLSFLPPPKISLDPGCECNIIKGLMLNVSQSRESLERTRCTSFKIEHVRSIVLYVVFAAQLVYCGPVKSQALPGSVCNVPIRDSVARVLEKVQRDFGKTLSCQTTDSKEVWSGHALVLSVGQRPTIRPDGSLLGSPVIVLSNAPWHTDAEILHQLLQLELIAGGFPARIGIPLIPTGVDRGSVAAAGPILQDIIEHRMFYPRMRSMGFDPDGVYRDELASVLSAKEFTGWNDTPILRSVHYAYAAAVVNDREVMREVDSSYRKRGWDEYMAVGQRLKNSVVQTNVTTPDGEAKELINALNILFANKFPLHWVFQKTDLYLGVSSLPASFRK